MVIKLHNRYLRVADSRFWEDPKAFIEAYPDPDSAITIDVEEIDAPDDGQEVVETMYFFGWRDGTLYDLSLPEELPARDVYLEYGQKLGADNAGVAFTVKSKAAVEALRGRLDDLDNSYRKDIERDLTRIEKGEEVTFNAYDHYHLWREFEDLYGDRFKDQIGYEDDDIWMRDTVVLGITYFDGSNFRTLVIEGDEAGLDSDIELAAPHECLWAIAASRMCRTRAGERNPGIIVYTEDGDIDSRPAKVVSYWQGTSWFSCWLEWEQQEDEL